MYVRNFIYTLIFLLVSAFKESDKKEYIWVKF